MTPEPVYFCPRCREPLETILPGTRYSSIEVYYECRSCKAIFDIRKVGSN